MRRPSGWPAVGPAAPGAAVASEALSEAATVMHGQARSRGRSAYDPKSVSDGGGVRVESLDDPGRNAHGDASRRDVAEDDSVGADLRVVADGDAAEQLRAGADVDVAAE